MNRRYGHTVCQVLSAGLSSLGMTAWSVLNQPPTMKGAVSGALPIAAPSIHLRSMNFYDNEQVLELCRENGILLGDQVNCTMIKLDHNCLHVAEDVQRGQIVAVCSGFNINSQVASFGQYALLPQYRHFGIGNSLWLRCVDHCQNRNSVILASAKNVAKYREKSGFTVLPARKLIQFAGFPQLFLLNKYHESCDLEWIHEQNLEEISAYDEIITGFSRQQFIKYSIAESSSVGIAARCIESGRILGYGIFRRCADRETIVPQPLYADTVDIAEVLIYSAMEKFAGFKRLAMECWDVNDDACRILATNRLGLDQQRYSTVMFTEHDLGVNFKQIFASSPSPFYPF